MKIKPNDKQIDLSTEEIEDETYEKEFDDVYEMIDDIRNHTKNNGPTLKNTDFLLELKFGWTCEKTGKVFTIEIRKFKQSAVMFPEKGEMLCRAIQSQEGKKNLTDWFNTWYNIKKE